MPATPRPSRPAFTPGYGLQSKAHDVTTFPWDEAERRLEGSRNYWIVSARADARPHAMPVWGLWFDSTLFFSTDAESVKGRNLRSRPEVVAHLESGDDVVILEGTAELVRDRALLARFADLYDEKYSFRVDVDDPAFTVFAVRPRGALTWLERDFVGTATRWRLDGDGAQGSG